MSASAVLEITDESVAEEVGVRTTVVPEKNAVPGSSGINLIRMVEDHGPVVLAEIDDEIRKCEDRLSMLRAKRIKVERLIDVAYE